MGGAGDFDGSGLDEILWHDSANGDTGYWTTDSSANVTGFHDFGFANTSYSVAAVGDYNGDGRSAIRWPDSSAEVAGGERNAFTRAARWRGGCAAPRGPPWARRGSRGPPARCAPRRGAAPAAPTVKAGRASALSPAAAAGSP